MKFHFYTTSQVHNSNDYSFFFQMPDSHLLYQFQNLVHQPHPQEWYSRDLEPVVVLECVETYVLKKKSRFFAEQRIIPSPWMRNDAAAEIHRLLGLVENDFHASRIF